MVVSASELNWTQLLRDLMVYCQSHLSLFPSTLPDREKSEESCDYDNQGDCFDGVD